MPTPKESKNEYEISKILHDAFGWALPKDRALFESIFANDDDFFSYFPDSKSTAIGWNQFENFLDGWMDPRNIVKGFEIRNLRIVFSKNKEVAWFSAIVENGSGFGPSRSKGVFTRTQKATSNRMKQMRNRLLRQEFKRWMR